MADPAENSPSHWKSRSSGWALTTSEAAPKPDPFNDAIIAAANIQTGFSVLDLAAGTGEPSITIAKKLSELGGGTVTACDLTWEMLSIAARRAQILEFSIMRFVIGDMAKLPFPDARFDAGTCRSGLMFPADKPGCVAEARRVLKPGAWMVYQCWGLLEKNPAFTLFAKSMAAFFGEEFPLRMVRHCLGEAGAMTGLLTDAGFSGVEEYPVTYDRVIEPGDAYFKRGIQRTWPDRVDDLSEQEWESLLKLTGEIFSDWKQGDAWHVPNTARLCVGIA